MPENKNRSVTYDDFSSYTNILKGILKGLMMNKQDKISPENKISFDSINVSSEPGNALQNKNGLYVSASSSGGGSGQIAFEINDNGELLLISSAENPTSQYSINENGELLLYMEEG